MFSNKIVNLVLCLSGLAINSAIVAQPFTPCQDSVIIRIGLISDPQYCDCDPSGTRVYRETLKKLPAAIDTLNKYQMDFVMNLGDMIDRYYESYDSISDLYEELTMPYYNLLGNHEFGEIPDSLKDSILTRYGMPDYYYHFIYKNWRFLVLDGTELTAYSRSLHPGLAEEGDSLFQVVQDSINHYTWNGGIGRVQRVWITDQIQNAYREGQHVILFCHFPVFPDSVDLNLWNDDEIVRLIEDHPNVMAFISGHNHPGNYGFKNGIHYVNQAAMFDTYEHNSFSILEIHPDRFEFKGFGLNPDRTLHYKSPFKLPFTFELSDSVLLSTYQEGSFIGKFLANPATEVFYSLGPDTGGLYNGFFNISHDSLFLQNVPDVSFLENVPILVSGINCQSDTVQMLFTLTYDALNLSAPDIADEPAIRIYPNPINDVMYILPGASQLSLVRMTISDLSGRLIKSYWPVLNPLNGLFEVRLDSGFLPGTYLVRLYMNPGKTMSGKIIYIGL